MEELVLAGRPNRPLTLAHFDKSPADNGLWDGLACYERGLDPRGLSFFKLRQRLRRRPAKGRAVSEVGNVGDIPIVLLAMENLDVIILHD
jgi:hypothetical protein